MKVGDLVRAKPKVFFPKAHLDGVGLITELYDPLNHHLFAPLARVYCAKTGHRFWTDRKKLEVINEHKQQ